jgi:Questin oxidase-like
MEALAMSSTAYDFLHKYLDDPSYTKPSTYSTTSPLEILHKIASDTRFDGLFPEKGYSNIETLFSQHEDLVLEHWNAWKISNPTEQFRDSQEAAMNLLVRTVKSGTHAYDFFIVHLLTTSHAVRILLPVIPKKFHVSLVRQWWLLTIAVYIAQLRPETDDDLEVKPDKGWKYVEEMAVNGPWATDAHYIKGTIPLGYMF